MRGCLAAGNGRRARAARPALAARASAPEGARQVALAPEQRQQGQRNRRHGAHGPPEAVLLVYQRHKLKVHAEDAGDQVQRQKHSRQRSERAHDVVGAVALH